MTSRLVIESRQQLADLKLPARISFRDALEILIGEGLDPSWAKRSPIGPLKERTARMTAGELARVLGVEARTVRRLRKPGETPSFAVAVRWSIAIFGRGGPDLRLTLRAENLPEQRTSAADVVAREDQRDQPGQPGDEGRTTPRTSEDQGSSPPGSRADQGRTIPGSASINADDPGDCDSRCHDAAQREKRCASTENSGLTGASTVLSSGAVGVKVGSIVLEWRSKDGVVNGRSAYDSRAAAEAAVAAAREHGLHEGAQAEINGEPFTPPAGVATEAENAALKAEVAALRKGLRRSRRDEELEVRRMELEAIVDDVQSTPPPNFGMILLSELARTFGGTGDDERSK